MSLIRCHRCGRPLPDGSPKYRVDVSVRSMFDGVIPDLEEGTSHQEIQDMLATASGTSEEQLMRQVYEDDAFIMCMTCKEAFLDEIYSHLHPKASPETGRDHLIN
ncbi:hypothetical protein ACFL2Q_01155 [Thermodesulfobacteriota bacterium]